MTDERKTMVVSGIVVNARTGVRQGLNVRILEEGEVQTDHLSALINNYYFISFNRYLSRGSSHIDSLVVLYRGGI